MKYILISCALFLFISKCENPNTTQITKHGIVSETIMTNNAWDGVQFFHVVFFSDGSTRTIRSRGLEYSVRDLIVCTTSVNDWKYPRIERAKCKLYENEKNNLF